MRWLTSIVILLALLAAPSAHAMGYYVNLNLLAWNTDGTSALVVRTASSSGQAGETHDLILVTTGDKQPLVVTWVGALARCRDQGSCCFRRLSVPRS